MVLMLMIEFLNFSHFRHFFPAHVTRLPQKIEEAVFIFMTRCLYSGSKLALRY